jgi:phage terminase Nu1 subunit (DNA packaging protein)
MKVNRAQLAELLGTTETTLGKWAEETPPLPLEKQGRGRTGSVYDTAVVIRWYVDRAVRKAGAQTPRDRLFAIQYEEAQLRLDKARGTLVPIERLAPALERMAATARSALLTEMDKAAPILELTEGVEGKRLVLDDIARGFLERLSNYDDPSADESDTDEDSDSEGDGETQAAAEDDSLAVGRDVPLS